MALIPRYVRTRLRELWSTEHRLQVWLHVELLVCEAWAKRGVVPVDAAQELRTHASIDAEDMLEWERKLHHDVAAFLRAVTETVSTDAGRWLHFGLTSTDLVDTAQGYLLRLVNQELRAGIDRLCTELRTLAQRYQNTVMVGRTHGMIAEPITLGLKFARWHAEMERHQQRFQHAAAEVEVGKLAGAVGTYATVEPEIEEEVCQSLGLTPARLSSQVIPRDRHAHYVAALALLATSLEAFATEIRHLQRSEVGEVAESFATTQMGSSAMPHKRNPIGCENITGLARIIRSHVIPAYENVVLWHERDISHSSVERIILPDATQLLDYMLQRFTQILENLCVNEQGMAERWTRAEGEPCSHYILLALIRKGWTRVIAYELLQKLAQQARQTKVSFRMLVEQTERIQQTLTTEELASCFASEVQLRHVSTAYRKAGLE